MGGGEGHKWRPRQKSAQLSEDGHLNLHDIACCWLWLRKFMVTTFPGELVEKHDTLFANGLLASHSELVKGIVMLSTISIQHIWYGGLCPQMRGDSSPNAFGRQMHLTTGDSLPNAFGWR